MEATMWQFREMHKQSPFLVYFQSLTSAVDKQRIPRGLASVQQGYALGKLLKAGLSKDTLEGETLGQAATAGYSFMLPCFPKYCNASTVRK